MKAMALRGGRVRKIRLPRMGAGPQIVAVLLVLGLVGAMAIEPTRQLIDQRNRIAAMSADLGHIERSNKRLENRITRLKDPDFLEQRAREIGLVRPNETTYVVMPPSRAVQRQTEKAREPKVEPKPESPGFVEGMLHFLGVR